MEYPYQVNHPRHFAHGQMCKLLGEVGPPAEAGRVAERRWWDDTPRAIYNVELGAGPYAGWRVVLWEHEVEPAVGPRPPAAPVPPAAPPGYAEYVRSERWAAVCHRSLRRAGYRCDRCAAPPPLLVRPKHYGSLGHERDRDLEVLCPLCYEKAASY